MSCKARAFALALAVSALSLSLPVMGHLPLLQQAHAEQVIFIVPGSSHPASVADFDPKLQIIESGQSIVFVNPDKVDHRLVVKAADSQVFDTGVLEEDQFASYTFSENGEYSLQCLLYPHMNGEIRVTDDIATFTKEIPEHDIDVQLSMSPASPGVDEEAFFKLIFVDKETGRNHPHVDYQLTFEDPDGNLIDGTGGHTIDGAEYSTFSFSEGTFIPKVRILAIDWLPAGDVTIEFNQIVTPEFPAAIAGVIAATAIGSIVLYGRRRPF